ncbi:hypothetical protein V8C86DRAFT_2588240 [Haematococcus lacustris]
MAAVSRTMWAFAMQGLHDDPVMSHLMPHAQALLPQAQPRDTAAILWALAAASHQQDAAPARTRTLLPTALATAWLQAPLFTPAQLAEVVGAAAALRALNPVLDLPRAAQQRAGQPGPGGAGQGQWPAVGGTRVGAGGRGPGAGSGPRAGEGEGRVVLAGGTAVGLWAGERGGVGSGQHLLVGQDQKGEGEGVSLGAGQRRAAEVGGWQQVLPPLIRRAQELLLQAPHRFKLADIATIMWAMTSLRHRSDAVADSVTRHVLRHIATPVAGRDGATPRSDTAWEDPHALLPHSHQAGDAEHLASLVHSMAALSYYDPVLFKVAAAVIEPDLDLLDTEQLVQLIWAYAVTITDAATYAEPDENPRQLHDRCAVGGSGQSEVGAHCRLLRAAAEMLAASAPSVTYGLTRAEVFALWQAHHMARIWVAGLTQNVVHTTPPREQDLLTPMQQSTRGSTEQPGSSSTGGVSIQSDSPSSSFSPLPLPPRLLAEVLALGTPGQLGGPGARMGAGQRRHMANLAKSLAGEGWQVLRRWKVRGRGGPAGIKYGTGMGRGESGKALQHLPRHVSTIGKAGTQGIGGGGGGGGAAEGVPEGVSGASSSNPGRGAEEVVSGLQSASPVPPHLAPPTPEVSHVERGWGAEDPMAGLLTSSGAWCGAVKGGVKLAVLLQGAEHVTSTRPRQLTAEHQVTARILAAHGWRVLQLPLADWARLARAEQQALALRSLLHKASY